MKEYRIQITMDNQQKKVSIITPFYNEGEGIDYFYESLSHVLNEISGLDFEVVCIDDGSHDNTLDKLISLTEKDSRFSGGRIIKKLWKRGCIDIRYRCSYW